MILVTSQHSDAAGHRPTLAPVPALSSSEYDLTDWIEVSMSEFKALIRSLAGVLRRLSAGCRAVAEAESRFYARDDRYLVEVGADGNRRLGSKSCAVISCPMRTLSNLAGKSVVSRIALNETLFR